MTLEITEYRCRACGHPLGKEEYFRSCSAYDQKVKEGVQQTEKDIRLRVEEESKQEIQNLKGQLIKKDTEQKKLLEDMYTSD